MIHKPNVLLSLSASEGLTLDPWRGFRGSIVVSVRSGEDGTEDKPPWLIEYHSPAFLYHGTDATQAFVQGLLVIRDEAGNSIPISIKGLQGGNPYLLSTSWLRGSRVDEYPLRDIDRNLLRQMRKHLVPGSSYTLALSDRTFSMKVRFMKPDESRLRLEGGDCQANLISDDIRIPFAVLTFAPVPRFTYSVSTSSNIYFIDDSISDFSLIITITSLNPRLVEIPFFELCGLSCGLRIRRVVVDVSGWVPIPSWPRVSAYITSYDNAGSGTTVHGRNVRFPCGGTWTGKWRLEKSLRPIPTDCYALQSPVGSLNIQNWNYGDVRGTMNADDSEKWGTKGIVEAEPVLHGWNDIEAMLESERPMPFFRSPREIRDMIYDYVKYADGVGEVRFTVQDMRSPTTQ
ncbi:MAG: hypothetical protein Q9219_001967 [cf. Caloplaca sp. 3 TL-2023]